MINKCTRDELILFPEMKAQYDVEYPLYEPESAIITKLNLLITEKNATIVLGTWCGDSKLQVPRFLKLMDVLQVNEDDITFICVDGAKKAENGLIDNLSITNVPTFIVYQKNKELGRIIESPETSLENDLLLILEKK